MRKIWMSSVLLLLVAGANAQNTKKDTTRERDLIDIGYRIIGKDPSKRGDTAKLKPGRLYFSGSPSLAYSLQTSFAAYFAGNFAFYTGSAATTNISSVILDVDVTENKQLLVPLASSIWTKDNQYNFIGDWRYLKYPETIYGIGGYTTESDGYTVNYDYVRVYQFALKKIATNFYAGPGIQYDRHFNIAQLGVANRETDFDKYGFTPTSTSTGVSVNFLYNNVKNSINPEAGGLYANLILRQNLTFLGSDKNWNSALIDVRKYFGVGHKGNILAFWTYDWLTLSGNPPYLDLPSNGWDTYSNTGRGYIKSRFAGKKMVYLEGEYRFGITKNGLLGGVVFTNAESFTELNNTFQVISPAAGAGLRIKFNKFSRTNLATDYGVGKGGSHGLFFSLGEIF